MGLWLILLTRLCCGLSQGPTFPSGLQLVSQWLPFREQGLGTGCFSGASSLGIALTWLFCPYLIQLRGAGSTTEGLLGGWESAFNVPAFLAILWCLAWNIWGSSQPESSTRIGEDEKNCILKTRVNESVRKSEDSSQLTLLEIFSSPFMFSATFVCLANCYGF